MEPLAYLNGRFLPQSRATLALNDAGFVLGATVTDLCRTFQRRLYRWPEHLARFRASCRRTFLDVPYSDDDVTKAAAELLARNPGDELALVLFATPGPVGYYLGEPGGAGDQPSTFGMHTFPLPFARYRALVERGADLVVPTVRQVPAQCVDPRIKQRSRLHWWLAEQEARRIRPGAQALLLDAGGHVTETAAANFLIVRGGTVLSPPRDSVLGGISLAVVEELCARLGIPLEFKALMLDDCAAADEAMLASTPYCLAGVHRLNDATLPWPGPVFRRLMDAWNAEVELDVHGQIRGG